MTDLTSGEIPIPRPVHPSLISILRAHSEVNLSNLLAYFFRGDYKPELQETFLTALIDSIEGVDPVFLDRMIGRGYKAVEVFTEYVAGGGGRIDILIVDHSQRQSERTAIIIENKLYHELNNDLDDYFYTVSNDFDILTKNIVVVVLSLKPYEADHPENMNWANVLHRDLKLGVRTLKDEESLLNDPRALQLVEEYEKHIDDLYLESFSFGNPDCFAFYFENREPVNALVKGQTNNASVNSVTNDHQAVLLHRTIESAVREYYNHYIKITDRNVQGQDYFRGRGLSRDLIRYKLDFNDYFDATGRITLTAYLNLTRMDEYGIDVADQDLATALGRLSIPLLPTGKDGWFVIQQEQLLIESPQLNLFFKQKIDQRWDGVEKVLGDLFKSQMIDRFHQSAVVALKAGRTELDVLIIDGQVYFSGIFNQPFVRYSLRLFAPDLVEIILYVNVDSWDKVSEEMEKHEGFINFTDKQSYTIDALIYENSVSRNEYFDAFYKKSYRIPAPVAGSFLTPEELELWYTVEKDILYHIDPMFVEEIEDEEDDYDSEEDHEECNKTADGEGVVGP